MPGALVEWSDLAKGINQESAVQYGNETKDNTCSASELELGIKPENPDNQNKRKNYDAHVEPNVLSSGTAAERDVERTI
jgi:hypothetical protein